MPPNAEIKSGNTIAAQRKDLSNILTALDHSKYEKDIERSLSALSKGGIILYPTDTVWGIGCDATDESAVEKVYGIKRRKESNSMLVLVDSIDMLSSYVHHVPDIALQLIRSTQKPLTVIYPEAKNLPANLTAKDGSIGIRITTDPFCQQLIKQFGKPVVSTSANVSGEKTPRMFCEISEEIKSKTDYMVRWRQDEQQPAHPSSIIKIYSEETYEILRD